jgi:radical SAM superfamily enzyme YgiQ (UPF0313 family)
VKILLVSPKSNFPDARPAALRIPQLTLPILTGLTPHEHDVLMVEDEYERLPLDEHWDAVGITAVTATAPRAYELACLFRQRGAKVILGGIHPSVLPGEAARYADAVVVGEAEGVWEQILDDVKRNRLREFYYNSQPDISQSPLPVRKRQRSLFGIQSYVTPIMASRGCPYDCEFCCVHSVYGRRQRHLPIEHITEDIRRSGARRVMFLDDNIGGARSCAIQLFGALEPLKVEWYAQASTRFILDDEMFSTAVRSGLKALFVGVESIEPEARKIMPKSLPTIELLEDAIRRCRHAGVVFHASLIFGRDEDTPRVFERTLDFLMQNAVPSISPCVLTPYPGTPLFKRLKQEGRILHTNWGYYDHTTVCYRPKHMTPEELAEKYLDFRNRFFSYSSMIRRAPVQLRVRPILYLGANIAYRKTTAMMKKHFENYFKWLHGQPEASVLDRVESPPLIRPHAGI